MSLFKVKTSGFQELENELQRLNSVKFDAVKKKQAVQMLNRARASGGTPVDTGELRISSTNNDDEMGYTKEYAAHVEYGHRTVNGGYVEGQRYLQKNVDTQRPIYASDLVKAIKKGDEYVV